MTLLKKRGSKDSSLLSESHRWKSRTVMSRSWRISNICWLVRRMVNFRIVVLAPAEIRGTKWKAILIIIRIIRRHRCKLLKRPAKRRTLSRSSSMWWACWLLSRVCPRTFSSDSWTNWSPSSTSCTWSSRTRSLRIGAETTTTANRVAVVRVATKRTGRNMPAQTSMNSSKRCKTCKPRASTFTPWSSKVRFRANFWSFLASVKCSKRACQCSAWPKAATLMQSAKSSPYTNSAGRVVWRVTWTYHGCHLYLMKQSTHTWDSTFTIIGPNLKPSSLSRLLRDYWPQRTFSNRSFTLAAMADLGRTLDWYSIDPTVRIRRSEVSLT